MKTKPIYKDPHHTRTSRRATEQTTIIATVILIWANVQFYKVTMASRMIDNLSQDTHPQYIGHQTTPHYSARTVLTQNPTITGLSPSRVRESRIITYSFDSRMFIDLPYVFIKPFIVLLSTRYISISIRGARQQFQVGNVLQLCCGFSQLSLTYSLSPPNTSWTTARPTAALV